MGIPSINSLANMEYMLYGGNSGLNMNCPSYLNGYVGGSMNNYANYANMYGFNPNFKGYQNNDIFTHQNDVTNVNKDVAEKAANGNTQVDWSNPQFKGLSDDLNELGDYYVKNSAPSESFMGAAVGGAAFGLMNNPRMIVHPWNSIKTTFFTNETNKMFADVKKSDKFLYKLWNDEVKGVKGGYEILSNAYSRMHKLEALNNWKFGFFRRSIKGVKDADGKLVYERLKGVMEKALKSGDVNKIAEATELLKRETNAMTGYVPRFMRWAKIDKPFVWLRKKFINPTHYEADIAKVADKAVTEAGAKTTFKEFMKHSCGIGNGLLFAGMEFAMDMGKISTAFSKDTSTGMQQIGQTALKGAGSAIGWAVGEGIGAFAGAKLGAMAGTAIAPGVGTAIGAVAGLIGGSIGCWLMGKITHSITGQDVGTKVEVENMKKTKEGQYQLLTLTAQQADGDKKITPRTLQALQNVANFYGAGV